MREKITFEERVQCQLDRAEAKQVESRNGTPEYMRVCDGDTRIMFAPPALKAAIKASGASAGDIIQIDKLTARGRIQWEVAIVSEPAAAPARPAAKAAAAPPAQPAATQDRATAADAAAMASSFAAAILATGQAEQAAQRAGVRDLRLTDRETITRVALSIYIGRQKEGRA